MLNEVEIQGLSFLAASKIAKALEKMAKQRVKPVEFTTEIKPAKEMIQETLDSLGSDRVVAYTQIISGLSGISLLMMSQDDATVLSDLLNKREVGTTQALQEIDKSAIKETLNILGNTYTNILADSLHQELELTIPFLAIDQSVDDIVKRAFVKTDKNTERQIIRCSGGLEIADHQIKIYFYTLFEELI